MQIALIPDHRLSWLWLALLATCDGDKGEDDSDSTPVDTQQSPVGPICSNCQLLIDSIAECDHSPDADDGDTCDTQHCIFNELQSDTCEHNPRGDLPPDCSAGFGEPDAAFFQQRRLTDYCDPAPTVSWQVWHHLVGACPGDASCNIDSWTVACTLPSVAECAGTAVGPGYYRGDSFNCDTCP